jgi:hypothetical protein
MSSPVGVLLKVLLPYLSVAMHGVRVPSVYVPHTFRLPATLLPWQAFAGRL